MDEAPKKEERKGFVRDTMRKFSVHVPRSEGSFQSKLSQYDLEIKALQDKLRHVEHDSENIGRHLERGT